MTTDPIRDSVVLRLCLVFVLGFDSAQRSRFSRSASRLPQALSAASAIVGRRDRGRSVQRRP
jgi:hypothetical protein